MGELKAEENPVLKGGSQLSFTTMQRWGKRDHAWTAGDTASKSLILQFVVNGLFQGFVYILRQNVSPAHACSPHSMLSVLQRDAGHPSGQSNALHHGFNNGLDIDRKSTRLNSSHLGISY